MIFSPRPTLVIDLDARPALRIAPRRVPRQFRPSLVGKGSEAGSPPGTAPLPHRDRVGSPRIASEGLGKGIIPRYQPDTYRRRF